MDIDNLTDQEKSVLLAKAMGNPIGFRQPPGVREFHPVNLYYPVNMVFAWLCLNWASEQDLEIDSYSYPYVVAQGVAELFDTDVEIRDQIWAQSPADAQRLWLDRILELAIEAGLVELEGAG